MSLNHSRQATRIATVALMLVGASSLFAGEGVLEIDQACVAGGCFPGDTPGLPVQITQTGSYRLTSNLTVPDAGTDGIRITANDVALDLGGFAILGPVTCSGNPKVCSPSGIGTGINALSTNHSRIHNGNVRGMGDDGVSTGLGATVDRVYASSNGGDGIDGDFAFITDCVAEGNEENGINTQGGTVTSNVAYSNGSSGIFTVNALVSNNFASNNDGAGISASIATVTGNTVAQNDGTGISGANATVSFNTSFNNGEAGIRMTSEAMVIGNTVDSNTGYGLILGAGAGFRENVISDNIGGQVQRFLLGATVVDLGANACDGSTTCTIDNP
jgi:hypothetical protein